MLALFTQALLLLASAVVVHAQTPSVVTFISISPTPTTEGVFTIQTSVPGGATSEGSMGIPPGETPLPSSLASIITDPLLSSTSPVSASASASASMATSGGPQVSRPGNPPPEQSTGASPSLQSNGTPFKVALAVSGMSLVGAAFIFF